MATWTSAFPFGVFRDQRFEIGDRIVGAALGDRVRSAALTGTEPLLVEPSRRRDRKVAVRELGQRRAAPQRERVIHPIVGQETLEQLGVEAAITNDQAVAHLVGDQVACSRPEASPQPRDLGAERGGGIARQAVAPQSVDQRAGMDRAPRLDEKHRQQQPLLRAGNGDRSVVVGDFEWPEEPVPKHASTLCR